MSSHLIRNGLTFDENHCYIGVGLVCRSVGSESDTICDLSPRLSLSVALSLLLSGMKDWMEESERQRGGAQQQHSVFAGRRASFGTVLELEPNGPL